MDNETILYKNNQPSSKTTTLNLNESYKNFEYLLFGYLDCNNYLGSKKIKTTIFNDYKNLVLGGIISDPHVAHQVTAAINIINDTEIQQRTQKSSYTRIVFIIGINRVS